MTPQQEALAKLHKFKTGAIMLYQEYLKAFDLEPEEQVDKLEELHETVFNNKSSPMYGLETQINEIEFSIDDGDILEIQLEQIRDCDSINPDEYELNSTHPDWRGAIDAIREKL